MTLSFNVGWRFAALAIGRVRTAKRHALVDSDIVTDLGSLANHSEPVIDEKILPDLGARVNVDGSQKTAEVVHQPREEVQLRFEQPMRDLVQA